MNDVVYCGQCGQANPPTNKFCGKCGSAVSLPGSQSIERQPNEPNACPKCRKADRIQKLSSIVSVGTHQTTGTSTTSGRTDLYDRDWKYAGDAYSSSRTAIDAKQQSELAKKVSLPEKPHKPHQPSGSAPMVAIVVTGVIALCIGPYVGSQLDNTGVNLWVQIGGCFGSVLLVVVVGGFIASGLSHPTGDAVQQYQQQLSAYEKELDEWNMAYQRWEKMYYCYRDDVIFIPGEEMVVASDQTFQLCYHRPQ
jgi:hypothetical protein